MSPSAFLILLLLTGPARAESFRSWAARASREEREKNDKAAFQSYSNALSTWKPSDGKNARARILCARAALRDRGGDEAGALSDYTDCLAVDKKNSKAYHRRGQLRMKEGKIPWAIDDFYRAIALNLRYGEAYFDRGAAYEKKGDREFAGEDYRRACELGVKAACAKAKQFPRVKRRRTKRPSKPDPSAPGELDGVKPRAAAPPDPEEAPDPDAAASPAAAAPAPAEAAPPAPKPRRAPTYVPRFRDCLNALHACADDGTAFGACVNKAPACEQKAVKGCCPGACLMEFRKSLNRGSSEAQAFREIFIPEATCAAPPRSDDD